MSTFAQIKDNVAAELGDISTFSDRDIDDAVQDAYDETVALSQCIIKKTTLSFQANLNYYDMISFASDYIATTAIFSNLTNLWLLDDKTLKDFDKDRIDWELWTGAAVWWAPCNDARHIAIVPKQLTASGTFDHYYWASAPPVVDSASPLVPVDFHDLIEMNAIGLLLESIEEFAKAKPYFEEYFGIHEGQQNFDLGVWALAARSKNIAKSDLLMLA